MPRYRPPIDSDLMEQTDEAAKARAFRALLVNTLVSGVTGTFVWFALVFWAYLETRSVLTTAVIGAAYSLAMAFIGPAFGTFVDRNRKHTAMLLATATSVACFALATALFVLIDAGSLLSLTGVWFWLLTALVLGGSVAGAMRGIALSTCVSLLVPEERRDRANGLVGTVNGVAFAITSVFSGIVIGQLGMGWALYLSLGLTVVAFVHLVGIRIPEAKPEPMEGESTSQFDVRSAVDAIRGVPGLPVLIALAAFNNMLGGVFMALMDAYGLELVSVETWGLLWGFIMLAFIAGGIAVAKFGLGRTPVKLIVTCNLVNWVICSVFAVQSSIPLLTIGCFVWLFMMPVIEAAEQTVLQRSIPFEKQGRVFGFAQMVENAAAPVTSILMGPLAAELFIPLMTDGKGADWIGSWWGTGPERGLAVMFTLAGLIGLAVTLVFRASRSYRDLTTIRVEDEASLDVAAA
ncbi:MAG TPA: MFS transporter [Acidimicrobiales bacterium]|nr:MFS transporter [Acidimicrobiales bacterium]